MPKSCLISALAVLFLASCESTGSSGRDESESREPERALASENRGSGAGIWNMLADERKNKAARIAANRERQQSLAEQMERGREQFSPEVRRKLETWWSQFIRQDEAWLQSRYEWRALGEAEREVLVENLLIVMVRAYEQNKGEHFKRSRAELFEMGPTASPYLVAALAHGQGDAVIRRHCSELLGLIGRPALPSIERAYGRADLEEKMDLLAAAASMGTSGAPDSTSFFEDIVDDADDIRLRLRALEGLGKSRDSGGIPCLLRSLRDDDVSIRKFAAASLGGYPPERVAPALIDAMEAAERARRLNAREGEVVRNCARALKASTGQRFDRASEWRQWWSRR
ncbi:MAG: HEAT repeat domain-containing protein [Planctomycetes bacterium]|nr:HEAT repeat domain-containing protein [Planctomycetota bacterium]